jgi:hypothetical protein
MGFYACPVYEANLTSLPEYSPEHLSKRSGQSEWASNLPATIHEGTETIVLPFVHTSSQIEGPTSRKVP